MGTRAEIIGASGNADRRVKVIEENPVGRPEMAGERGSEKTQGRRWNRGDESCQTLQRSQ